MDTSTIKALAKEALESKRTQKPVRINNDEVVLGDGSVFHPMGVKTSSDLLRASVMVLFKHVADIHVTVVQIIADKFGLSVDDIQKAITEDPRWNEMLANPIITDLTSAAQETPVPPQPKKRGRPPKAAPKAAPTHTPVKKYEIVPEEGDLVFES